MSIATDFCLFIDIIVEHKIEIQHIPRLLTEKDMIHELIPNIGDRLNFIHKYEELFLLKKDNVSSLANSIYLFISLNRFMNVIKKFLSNIFHLLILIYFIAVRILMFLKWNMMEY